MKILFYIFFPLLENFTGFGIYCPHIVSIPAKKVGLLLNLLSFINLLWEETFIELLFIEIFVFNLLWIFNFRMQFLEFFLQVDQSLIYLRDFLLICLNLVLDLSNLVANLLDPS